MYIVQDQQISARPFNMGLTTGIEMEMGLHFYENIKLHKIYNLNLDRKKLYYLFRDELGLYNKMILQLELKP